MRPRGLPLQGVDKGCQKGAQAGHNLLEDLRGDLTFLKQLRFSNGVSGVHGSAPSGAHIFVSRPQKEFIHNDLEHVNEAKTVEVVGWGCVPSTRSRAERCCRGGCAPARIGSPLPCASPHAVCTTRRAPWEPSC